MNAPASSFQKLSILIAAYNEESTLRQCLTRVRQASLPGQLQREIIVVDDGSTDGTWKLARELAAQFSEIKIFQQTVNQGKGAAIRRAVSEMTGDLAIFQDADLEYNPEDYGKLLKPILDGRADVVYGSRFIGEERKILYFWHTAGNRFLTLLANMLNDTNFTDMETGYKAFVADALKTIPLESNRFGIEPEITAKISLNRFRIYEVPINYNGRTYEEGKKIGWRDGLAALWFIVKYRFSSNYADPGKVALDALEQAPRFNKWMYDSIKPHLGHRIVELGCGKGNLSKLLKQHGELLAADYRADYIDDLRERWGHLTNVRIERLDLTADSDYRVAESFSPDTVVCLNVLEHIEDDRAVLKRLQEILPSKARMVFLVPYNPKLTSEFDRQIGHFRRYQAGELEAKMKEAGFLVEKQFFFNKVGVIAWWCGNVVARQRTITVWQLKLYNFLTPAFRLVDPLLPGSGLSTVVVARKP